MDARGDGGSNEPQDVLTASNADAAAAAARAAGAAAALHAHALLLARYHMWAYERLLELCDRDVVSDEDYFGHTGVVFRSIHGTLNHLLLADTLWHRRVFRGGADTDAINVYWRHSDKYAAQDAASVPWETYIPGRDALADALRAQSKLWVDDLAALPPDRLLGTVAYRNTSGQAFEADLFPLLAHVFNHGTWHRHEVGDAAEVTKTFAEADVRLFSTLSLDTNPIHLDEAYARTTRFGRRIVHGLLVASMFSGLLGTRVPGVGAVYVSQSLQFKAPVFVDDTVTARVEITKIDPARRLVTLATTCRKADGTVVIQGEGVALVPKAST